MGTVGAKGEAAVVVSLSRLAEAGVGTGDGRNFTKAITTTATTIKAETLRLVAPGREAGIDFFPLRFLFILVYLAIAVF